MELEGGSKKAKEELLIELSFSPTKLLLKEKGSGPWVGPVPTFEGGEGRVLLNVLWLNGLWNIVYINDSPGIVWKSPSSSAQIFLCSYRIYLFI